MPLPRSDQRTRYLSMQFVLSAKLRHEPDIKIGHFAAMIYAVFVKRFIYFIFDLLQLDDRFL